MTSDAILSVICLRGWNSRLRGALAFNELKHAAAASTVVGSVVVEEGGATGVVGGPVGSGVVTGLVERRGGVVDGLSSAPIGRPASVTQEVSTRETNAKARNRDAPRQ